MDENQGEERGEYFLAVLYCLSLSLSTDKSCRGLLPGLPAPLPYDCSETKHQQWINERFVKPAVVWITAEELWGYLSLSSPPGSRCRLANVH